MHDDDDRPLGERCGGWWRGGRTATGVRVTHECSRPVGHGGACRCDCGARLAVKDEAPPVSYRAGTS